MRRVLFVFIYIFLVFNILAYANVNTSLDKFQKYIAAYKIYIKAVEEGRPLSEIAELYTQMLEYKADWEGTTKKIFISREIPVFAAPSSNSSIIGYLTPSIYYTQVFSKNGWVLIKTDSFSGWIKEEYLGTGNDFLNYSEDAGVVYKVKGAAYFNYDSILYAVPDFSSETKYYVAAGKKAAVTAISSNGWIQIKTTKGKFWTQAANAYVQFYENPKKTSSFLLENSNPADELTYNNSSNSSSSYSSSYSDNEEDEVSKWLSTFNLNRNNTSKKHTTSTTKKTYTHKTTTKTKSKKSGVITARGKKLFKVPTVNQSVRGKWIWDGRDHACCICGPSSLLMVMKYYGVSDRMKNVAKSVGFIPKAGTPIKGLVRGARKYGLKSKYFALGRRTTTKSVFATIKKSLDNNQFIIALVDTRWKGHYVVFTGYKVVNGRTYIQVNNSAGGRVELWPISKVRRYWAARGTQGVKVWR